MPKGTISASETDPAIIDIIHCPLRGNKGERKSLWRRLSLSVHKYICLLTKI